MNRNTLLSISVALSLAACASAPKTNVALESAHTAVQSAESDANVSQYAPLDLVQAKQELQMAQDAAAKHDMNAVNQHAYLASQSARLAQLHAVVKADEARLSNGQAERDKIQLEARSREVQQAHAQTATAVAQRDAAEREIEQLKATQTSRGLVMTLGDVLFDTGRSELKSGATRKLDPLVTFLNAHPNRRIEIDGFTDSVGSEALNARLSQQRAEAVKQALATRGIDATRVSSQGYGEAFPVASNDNAGGRQLNRRVEVVIATQDNAQIEPRSASVQ